MNQNNPLLGKKSMLFAWKLLLTLLLINYQIVVIVFEDFVLFKFLRDLVLVYILFYTFFRRGMLTRRYWIAGGVLALFFAVAALRTDGLGVLVVCLRRYFFPLGVLIAARCQQGIDRKAYTELIRYFFNLCAVLALWGIFQAHVLGDSFLMKIGYPTIYSYGYQRVTLNMSYYFGNFGIQRVTATVSNSNVFAIILGIAILLAYLNHKQILRRPFDWAKFAVILLGYVLTVSRSNFVAMIVVAVVILWKELPFKKQLFALAGACLAAFGVLYLVQDETGLSHKLVNWVINSLTFKESSAAGRSSFWTEALQAILANPLGIGLGKAGTAATTTGGSMAYACENSYLAMGLDLGWGGLAAYVACLGLLIWEIVRVRCKRAGVRLQRVTLACLIYFMIVCMFSNHIYDMEAVSTVYLFVGLGLNLLHGTAGQATKKKSVLFFFHSSDVNNGGIRSMLDVVDRLLDEKQIKVYAVFTELSGTAQDYLRKKGARVIRLRHAVWHEKTTGDRTSDIKRLVKDYLRQIRNAGFLVRIGGYIRKHQIDCIYSNTFACVAGAVCARLYGLPHIWHIREFGRQDHNMFPIFGWRAFYHLANRWTDRVIVISQSLYERYRDHISEDKLTVLYDDISADYINDERNAPEDVVNLLIAGTVQEGKRQMEAVGAVALAREQGANVHLYIAGGEVHPYADRVREHVSVQNMADCVTFLGYISDMNSLRSQMHIGLVCSQSEAFGRVTVEGMLSHMAMIGASFAGTRELISHEETGLLYPLGDTQELARQICTLAGDREMRDRLAEQGYHSAKKRFTAGNCAEGVARLLRAL